MGFEFSETTTYEFKVAVEERKKSHWLKTVSAFANGEGGTLIFGMDDDGRVVGLKDVKRASEILSSAIHESMDPKPLVSLTIKKMEGKELIYLRVFPGQETPYYYIHEKSRIACIRVGNESVPADAARLRQLTLQGNHLTYDALPSKYRFEELSFSLFRSVYQQRTGHILTQEDFESFNLLTEDGRLTNAGVLLADTSVFRHSRLFCTRWNGLTMASSSIDAIDAKEYDGSLIGLLRNGLEFVERNSKRRWAKRVGGRVELPEYPGLAVQEALVNALIHRDYLILGSEVHIDMFDDRLEIFSPGGMVDGKAYVQDRDMDHIPSVRRNPFLADVFNRLKYMERRGSGFHKITEEYLNATGFKKELTPLFYSSDSEFRVTLWNLNYNVPIGDAHEGPAGMIGELPSLPKELYLETFLQKLKEAHARTSTVEKAKQLLDAFGTETEFRNKDVMRIIKGDKDEAARLVKALLRLCLIFKISDSYRYRFRP